MRNFARAEQSCEEGVHLLKARDINCCMREKFSGPYHRLTMSNRSVAQESALEGERTGVKTPVMTFDKEVGTQNSDV
jgi:hypothetical protein